MLDFKKNSPILCRAYAPVADSHAPINIGTPKPVYYSHVPLFLDLMKCAEVKYGYNGYDLGYGGEITEVPASVIDGTGATLTGDFLYIYIAGNVNAGGSYKITWTGDDWQLNATDAGITISNKTYASGSGSADLVFLGNGSSCGIKMARVGGGTGPLNVSMQVLPVGVLSNGKTAADMIAAGEYCTPEFVATFMQDGKPPLSIRALDWCGTVGSIAFLTSADVKTVSAGSWAPVAPPAVMCSLAKQVGAQYLWTTIPSRADSTFRQAFMNEIKTNIPAGCTPFFQWSNETFNSIKSETQWGTGDAARTYAAAEAATFTYDDVAFTLMLVTGTVPAGLVVGNPICLATGTGRYRKITAFDATSITVDGSMDPTLDGATVQIILVDYNMVYSWQAQKSYETYQDAVAVFGAGNFKIPVDFRLGDGAYALDKVINPTFWDAVDPGHPAPSTFMDFTTTSTYFGRYTIYTIGGVDQALLDQWAGTNGATQDQAAALATLDTRMNAALDDMQTYLSTWAAALTAAGITNWKSIPYEGAQHAVLSFTNSDVAAQLVTAWLNSPLYAPAAAIRWVDIQRSYLDAACQYLSLYDGDKSGVWGGYDGLNGPTLFYQWVRHLTASISPSLFRVA